MFWAAACIGGCSRLALELAPSHHHVYARFLLSVIHARLRYNACNRFFLVEAAGRDACAPSEQADPHCRHFSD